MKMRIPNTNTLEAIAETARLGSFSAAADQLGLTQGAVAQKVRQFESDLGFPLFDRWARGLRPTAQCLNFLSKIEPALSEIAEAHKSLLATEDSNKVTVSTTPSIASRWLIPRLSRFYLHHADIVIAIDATEKLRRFVGPDAIDIALRWGGNPSGQVSSQLILENQLIAVASPNVLNQTAPLLDQLKALPLINDGHKFWQQWSAHFGINLPSKPLEFGQTNHAIDAAINGLGIALAPKMLVQASLEEQKLVEILPTKYQLRGQDDFLLLSKNHGTSRAVETVKKWLMEEAKI